ncbi:MAG: hypothetical protein KAS32_22400 [Candidatus Peribacteraceae bacterium]|nr:hypothetical protein [Candidatus Peribacteraceae bacterium]
MKFKSKIRSKSQTSGKTKRSLGPHMGSVRSVVDGKPSVKQYVADASGHVITEDKDIIKSLSESRFWEEVPEDNSELKAKIKEALKAKEIPVKGNPSLETLQNLAKEHGIELG